MNTLRQLVAVIAIVVLSTGAMALSPLDSIRSVIDNGHGEPIEGFWRMTGQGATVAITAHPGREGVYDIHILDSPDLSIEPLTLIGSATAGIKTGSYDISMVDRPGRVRTGRHTFIGTFDSNEDMDHLRLKAYHKGIRISLWRWIPYMFRVTVIKSSERPSDHDGLERIYPEPVSPFITL